MPRERSQRYLKHFYTCKPQILVQIILYVHVSILWVRKKVRFFYLCCLLSISTKDSEDNNNRDNRHSTSRIHFLGDTVKYGTNSTVSGTQVYTLATIHVCVHVCKYHQKTIRYKRWYSKPVDWSPSFHIPIECNLLIRIIDRK